MASLVKETTETVPRRVGKYVGKDRTQSVSGIEMSVLKSVIQKLFRYRYDETRITHAFYELVTAARACVDANKLSQAKAHRTWIVNRVFVIFCEDIGAAAPEVIFWIAECVNKLRANPEDLAAIRALALLVRDKRRNRDLSYLRYALFTSPRVYNRGKKNDSKEKDTAGDAVSSSSSSSSSSS